MSDHEEQEEHLPRSSSDSENELDQSNVTIITSDMPPKRQRKIIRIVFESVDKFEKLSERAKFIKQTLDNEERLWQVVIVAGQYWNFISHEPEASFIFKMGREVYLVWKTPGY